MGILLPMFLIVVVLMTPPPPSSSSSTDRTAGQDSVTYTISGTAVTLPEVLDAAGIAADSESIAKQVVLKSKSGEITPLLSDEASRALFVDERLRNRQTEVKYRKLAGLPYIRVVSFKIVENGLLRTPEYYCEICAISVRFPQICPCCQGEMVLRMKPEPR